ncbi:hypothetical protein CgunFtcFv8_018079 [Champsocephalus gunnari]|uniref:Uncharacterized protein n=1 Tax=Champsocephalus gunnari TaxID=52237 RepID=A0AAN8HR32_CHAGU|nr:hypothetical protein CgunFtcFv8_018079 [Champsocephalus gunnari]
MSAIRNVKKCVACQDKIFVACKKCPKCEAQQPHKDRLVKERKRFAAEEKEWKERIKKNCNGAHVLDSSFKMLDRLAALRYFPLLLLGKRNKNGYTADVFSSIQMKLDDCLEEDLKSVYAKVLKLHFRRFQNQKGTIEDCGTDLETEFVVLDFCPVDGTDLVVEATDVVEEGDYRSNAEGQGEQESQSHDVEVVNGGEPASTSVEEAAQGVAVSKNPETLTLGDFNKDGSMSSKRRGKRKPQNTDPLQGRFFFLKSYDGQQTKYFFSGVPAEHVFFCICVLSLKPVEHDGRIHGSPSQALNQQMRYIHDEPF